MSLQDMGGIGSFRFVLNRLQAPAHIIDMGPPLRVCRINIDQRVKPEILKRLSITIADSIELQAIAGRLG